MSNAYHGFSLRWVVFDIRWGRGRRLSILPTGAKLAPTSPLQALNICFLAPPGACLTPLLTRSSACGWRSRRWRQRPCRARSGSGLAQRPAPDLAASTRHSWAPPLEYRRRTVPSASCRPRSCTAGRAASPAPPSSARSGPPGEGRALGFSSDIYNPHSTWGGGRGRHLSVATSTIYILPGEGEEASGSSGDIYNPCSTWGVGGGR